MDKTSDTKKAIGIFFPPFSAVELIALIYPLLLFVIENGKIALLIIPGTIWDSLQHDIGAEPLALIIGWGLVLFGIYLFFSHLIKSIMWHKPLSKEEKKWFSLVFYIVLIFTDISSFDHRVTQSASGMWGTIENVFRGYILVRSLLAALILDELVRKNKDTVYAQQMIDKPVQKLELIIIFIAGTITFFFLQMNHDFFSTVVLCYFYTMTIIHAYRKIFRRNSES